MSSGVRVLLAFVALLVICVPLADAAKDDTELISRASDAAGGAGGDAGSADASISADGRFVAFGSDAKNLSDADDDAGFEIFVRDTQLGTTEFVSRLPDLSGGGFVAGGAFHPAISGDGRFIAFDTPGQYGQGGMNVPRDIYLRDMGPPAGQRTTVLVSRTSGPLLGGNGDSEDPSISADGNVIAFLSVAENLSADDRADAGVGSDIYVRDVSGGTTSLVSRATTAAGAGADGDSFQPSISADGRWIAFRSSANNLSDDDGPGIDVFVRDLETNTTTLVSRQSQADGGAGANGSSQVPSISADGQMIAFRSDADNLATDDDDAQTNNIYVRNLQTNTTTFVSRQSTVDGGAAADGPSGVPAISGDGRYIAFRSNANNLFPGTDDDAQAQVFVRDLVGGTTTLVSRQSAAGGLPATSGADEPTISFDGRFVAYESISDELSGADVDSVVDIFSRDFGEPVVPVEPDVSPPSLNYDAKGKLGKAIKVTITSDEVATVTVSGTAKPKGKRVKKGKKPLGVGSTSAALAAGTSQTLKLKPPKRVAKKLKKATKAKVNLTIEAVDAAGNTATQTLKIKLR